MYIYDICSVYNLSTHWKFKSIKQFFIIYSFFKRSLELVKFFETPDSTQNRLQLRSPGFYRKENHRYLYKIQKLWYLELDFDIWELIEVVWVILLFEL